VESGKTVEEVERGNRHEEWLKTLEEVKRGLGA
jgi:hemerythrin-like domain-containing protein